MCATPSATSVSNRIPELKWPLIACLYLTQGIPFGLAMEALPSLLRHQGADLAALSWLPLVSLPWVVKFCWAPVVDNHWCQRLGRRRSWILTMQSIIALILVVTMMLNLQQGSLGWLIALSALASLASATQDIATDALVAEQFQPNHLSSANAIQVAGAMIGFFYGGSLFLVAYTQFGETAALCLVLLPVIVSLGLMAYWREPETFPEPRPKKQQASLLQFLISGKHAWALMAAAFLSAATVVGGHGLSRLMLVDAGWQLDQIGLVGMIGGAITITLGCGAGAWLVARLGPWRAFFLGIVCSGLATSVWAYLALGRSPVSLTAVWPATTLASFGAGCTSVAVMTAAMHYTHARHQAGTDMTIVQSSRDLGEMAASSSLIALSAALGYAGGFAIGIVLTILTLAMIPILLRSRSN